MEEGPRTGGPTVVWAGPPDAPAVIVLDPAGVGRHGDLPGTWRPLTEYLQVMWCRLPAADEPRAAVLATVVLALVRRALVDAVAEGVDPSPVFDEYLTTLDGGPLAAGAPAAR